mgnify:CR=1 FL=1
MNYKKLAELTHVSVSTVSKAFSGSSEINDETRNEIFNTAKKYGCFDKYYKNKFTKKVIAVLCPEFCSSHYSAYAENIQKIISSRNDVAVFSSTNFDISLKDYLLDYYATYAKVDGIILIDNHYEKNACRYSVPIVVIGSGDNADSVSTSCNFGMNEAFAYLKGFGHRDICFIGERLTLTKEAAFLKAFASCNPRIIHSEKRFEEAGLDCAEKFLAYEKKPTAVIAAYDDIAIGFINALKRSGISIPADVSVIGIDNIPQSKYQETPLTTIDFKVNEATAAALDILYQKIEHPTVTEQRAISITPQLIKRETVTFPKDKLQ